MAEERQNGERSGKRKAAEVSSDPSDYRILKEGEADILIQGNDVFYNKAQVVNRDLSIAVLRAFVSKREKECLQERNRRASKKSSSTCNDGVRSQADDPALISDNAAESVAPSKSIEIPEADRNESKPRDSPALPSPPLRILEALAASGLRALRYAREVEGVGSVMALDKDAMAYEACKRNIKLNGSICMKKVQAEQADAKVYMLTHEKSFDVVDLDPYGSPSVFLDSAVQSIADGGVLMCTATDLAVLCGNHGEVCYCKYGAYPLKGKYCHEMALRILLASIESHANRYKRHIIPVLSVFIDFYVRVFVRVYTSPNTMKSTPSKLSYVYQCVGCDSYHLQAVGRISNKNNNPRYLPGNGPVVSPNCIHCGKLFNMGGPIWSEPIHDPEWVSSMLREVNSQRHRYPAFDKVHSLLTTVSEELLDVPLFISLHSISATLKCTAPASNLYRYAIVNAGYRVSGTHACPLGLKTDAPMDVIWDIMRCWVKMHPVKGQSEDAPGTAILSKEPSFEASFVKVASALSKAQAKGVSRFPPNPEGHWGPKPRAGRQITSKHVSLVGEPEAKRASKGEEKHTQQESEAKHSIELAEEGMEAE